MEEIETLNKFLVGARGDKVVIMLPPRGELSRKDALGLAAWLVAIAEQDNEFQSVLNAVRNT